MRRLSLVVLAAALACTTEVAPQNPYDPATPLPLQAKARVTGSVEAGASAPFAGLEIYLRQNGQLVRSFTTDPAGAFVFDSLTPGSYTLDAQAPGFAPVSMPLVLAAGADIDVGSLSLSPLGGADTGFLRGSARLGKVAAIPGGPVEEDPSADNGGILIEAVGTPYAAVTTSLGAYELALPPGTHTLRVSKPNYVARTLADLQVTLGVVSPVVVVVLATNPAKVTGAVVAELTGGGTGPLADALVTLDGTSATGLTNAAGQFTLDQLAPGSYLLRVLKDGYETASVPVLNLDGGEERVLSDPLSLTLQRGAIHGHVVLADTPADASGVVVEVTGSGRAVVTGADGAFAFDGLVAGGYEVRARRDGYAQQVATGLTVTTGAVVTAPTLTLTRQGGAVAIKDGAVTRSRAITLVLGAPSAAAWRASEDPAFLDPALGDTAGVSRPYTVSGAEAPFTLSDRDGAHTVHVVYLDGAGSASSPASAAIVLDRLAPAAPSVRVGTGVSFTRDAIVGLALSAQDLPEVAGAAVSGLHQMELANRSDFAGSVTVDYNLAYAWPLTAGDGLKAVYARFHDRAGNVSEPAVALVTLDTTPPEPADPVLSGGAGSPPGQAGSPLITVALSATDANAGAGGQDLQVRLANSSSFAGATWQPFAASVSWLLPPGDGPKTVHAQFMDPAGNQTREVHADITLAGTAPSGGGLTVAGGAAATRLQVVPVAVSATGAAEMRFSVNGVPQAAGWIPYATGASVDLGAAPDEATRTVSVAFRNSAGVEGGALGATIVFDQRAPTAPAVAVNGGAAFTGAPTVTLSLGATDAPLAPGGYASGLDAVELSADAAFTAPTVLPFATSAPWAFTVGDGAKTVWARFRDRAGNRSAAVSATVVLDTTAPGAPSLALSGGAGAQAGYTATPVVTATVSASDANEGPGKQDLEVRLANDAGFAGSSWQPYAGTLSWVLTAGDGAKRVWAQFRDKAGNTSLAVSADLTLASSPPSGGSLVLAAGAAATSLASVPASVLAVGAAEMRFYVNGAAVGGWVSYATSPSVSLAGVADETTATVSVLFRNAGGVEGATASASILVDRTAPTGGAVVVNGGAAYAGVLPVTLTLAATDGPAAGATASGLATVEVSNDAAFAASTTFPWATSIPWTLAAGADGTRTVHVRVKDRAGNTSAAASDAILLDVAGPGTPSLQLAGNAGAQAGYTGTPVVTATLSATDANEGAGKQNLQVRLGNDLAFSGSTWQPYATTLSWALPGVDGLKTVYAQFRDAAGNLSAVVNTTITLAATAPSGGSLTLAGGATTTNLPTVPAALTAVGAAQMRFYVNGVATGGWVAYAASAAVALGAAPDEAVRTVSVAFRNAGGVEGGGASATILLDQARPTAPAVVVNGGAAFTASTSVALALSASDGPAAGGTSSGLASVEVANNPAFTGSLTYAATDALTWTLAAGAEGGRTVWVRFRDRAGNLSDPASAGITFDQTGPTAPTLALSGNPEAQTGYTGSAVVTAALSATDTNEGTLKANLQVRLSNDSGFAGATWQPYATALPWVLPIGDGPKVVYAQFRDAAGNLSATATAPITLDATPPTGGAIAVALGAAATNQASVPAAISAAGAAQMQIYVNGAAQPGGWQPYAAATTVALGAAPDETTRTVSVVFRNFGGVEGGAAVTSILLDQAAPVAPAVSVAAAAAYTGATAVTLTLSASDGPTTGTQASGLATVEVANDALFTSPSTFAYATAVPWTLAAGADGARTVWVRFKDRAGNVSGAASDGITLDVTGPTAPSITLAGNATAQAGYTGTPVVTATLSATDVNEGPLKGNLEVRVSSDAGFAGASWQPYTTTLPWVLPLGDGDKTVHAQFRDAVGNVSLPVSASIALAETPPSAGTIALASGAPATNQQTVTATLGAVGATHMRLYVNGAPQGTGFVPYATSALVDLGLNPDESTRTVSAVFRNAGGVEGGDALATIVMDRTAPTSPAVTINGGAAYSSPSAVTLAVSAQDGPATTSGVASGLASVEVANDPAFTGAATFGMADTVSWTLPAGEGAKTVYVRFKDKAGNTSGAASASIVRDTLGPTLPTLAMLGNGEASPGYTGTPVVKLTLSATDTNEGSAKANLQVRVANEVGFSGVNWQPYTTSMQWVLPTGDGTKTVYAQFRDAAGNTSATASANIQLLATPPSGGSIVLASGAAATAVTPVPVAISASNAAKMQLSVNGTAVTGWVDYATSTSVALGAAPDQATVVVTVSFRNLGGVEGGAASAAIRYDHTAPLAGALAITGTLGNGTTSNTLSATPAVTLSITPPGADEVEMAVAQTGAASPCSGAFATPLWQPVSRTASLVLTGSDGAKRACVLFRDVAGNFAVASAAAANLVLDTTPPTNPTFTNLVSKIQNAATAPASGVPVVTASTDATSGGVFYQCTGGTGARYGSSWVDCGNGVTLPYAYVLAANAQSTLGVRARDAAYNYSPGSFVQIIHDDVAPFPPFIVDLRASRDSLTVTWDATGDVDVVTYLVHYGNSPEALNGTEAAQGPSAVQVPAVGGAPTGALSLTGLTVGLPYYVAVEAVDAAGNRSGQSGQRMAVPNKVNPRVLSAFGGQPRSVGAIATATRTYAYLAENQGLVQLDVTNDGGVPIVVGRAFLPDLVPDERAELAVIACKRGLTDGHCVLPTGTTLEGDYRGERDAYRAPTPVVFFPLTGTNASPAVGTIEALLPVRPHQVLIQTYLGDQYIYTVDRTGLRVFMFKAGQLAFLRQVARDDFPVEMTAVLGATVNGPDLYVYARPPQSEDSAPHLYSWDVSDALYGSLYPYDYGLLFDHEANALGDRSFGSTAPEPVPVMRGGNVFMAYRSDVTQSTWLAAYIPGLHAGAPHRFVELLNLGSGSDYGGPRTGSGGYANHLYVFTDWGLGSPLGTQVNFSADLGTLTEGTQVPQTNNSAFHVYSLRNHAGAERLFTVEDYSGSDYYLQRYTVNGAAIAIAAGGPFLELPPRLFVEADRYLYVAVGNRIFSLEAANPLTPNVVGTATGTTADAYTKLVVHGRYLYAQAGLAGLDIFKLNGDGSFTKRANLPWQMADFTVAGHTIFFHYTQGGASTLYAYNITGVATGAPTFVTGIPVTGWHKAMQARWDNSSAGSPVMVLYAAVANGAVDDVKVYTLTGGTLALANTVTAPIGGALTTTVAGDVLALSSASQTALATLYAPTSPGFSSSFYPVGAPTLLQGGYVVGAGPQVESAAAPNGPAFLSRGNGGVEGTLRYSTCGDAWAATSLAHSSGLYAAGCQKNGIVLFTPISAGGGRLLKASEVATSWSYGSAALAGDGMYNWVSGAGDSSRLFTANEEGLADGALANPVLNSAYLYNTALTGADPNRHAVRMLQVDGLVYALVGGAWGSGLTPSVDVYDPGNFTTYGWTFLGRYTFPTADPAYDMASDGEFLYVARGNRLDVVDLRNPVPSGLRATVTYAGRTPSAVAVARDRLYVALAPAGGSPEVRVWDVTGIGTGATSTKATFYPGSGTITGLAISGRMLAATLHDGVGKEPEHGISFVRLSAADRDGTYAAGTTGLGYLGVLPAMQPLDGPVFAGDALLAASNQGLATWDLLPLWNAGSIPTAAGGVNLADPFRAEEGTKLRIDGPWGSLVGGTYRVFDLR